jgi:hypothetical protein
MHTYFSRAMRSLLIRSRASDIFDKTYWVATYPAPSTPNPIANGVLFRRSHLRVAEIMAYKFEFAKVTFRS